MEFLSAADTAAGLLGTLKATVDATRLFYARATNPGEALHDNDLAFDKCHTALEMWTRFWGLDKRLSRRYQEALWGPEGSRTICRQLVKIKTQMEDVWVELSPLLDRAGITRETTLEVDWSSTVESRRGVAKIKSLLRKRDLWWFGRGKGVDLLSVINSVGASISDLRELSIACFSMVNGSSLVDQPPETLASAVGLKSFTAAVVDAKMAASMYFSALFDMIRTGIPTASLSSPYPKVAYLDTDLVKKKFLEPSNFQSFDNIPVRYSMSLFPAHQTYGEPLLVLVDGPHKFTESSPRPAEPVSVTKTELGIRDAVSAARQFSTSLFTVRSFDDTLAACFRVLPPRSDQVLDPCPSRPPESTSKLWDILYPLPFGTTGSQKEEGMVLPLSARITLARHLTLMCLFLGGTPWLSGTRHGIGKVMRPDFSDSGEIQRFFWSIKVDAGVPRFCNVQEWRQHLHSVGVALLELGMGMQLREIVKSDDGTGSSMFVFHRKQVPGDVPSGWVQSLLDFLRYFVLGPIFSRFSLVSLPSSVRLPYERVNMHLATAMGEQYASAVKQVLNTELWKNLNGTEDMKEVARKCWQELYLRIEEVAKAMELEETWSESRSRTAVL